MLLTTLLVVAVSILVAQEPCHSLDPDVIARLSYDNSGVVQQGNVRHVCIAVSRDGEYRIVRSTDEGRTVIKIFQQPSKRSGSGRQR